LPAEVLLCPVQLPGREGRLNESLFTSLPALVRAIAEALLPNFGEPFAFFGHSLGAIISFELARLLRKEHGIEPASLFVSGCRAPQLRGERELTFNLPESEFVAELRRLNGTPHSVLDHPELMRLMLPIIRADFEISQTYSYLPDGLLSCSISAYGGLQDPEVSRENLEAWRHQTTASFSLKIFPGDHFFIHSARSAFLYELSSDIEALLEGASSERQTRPHSRRTSRADPRRPRGIRSCSAGHRDP
jgi:medium-chain acyl-[acyl-carrier-protein] hydrolase